MDDAGQSSYEIDRVPAYKMAMKIMEEGLALHFSHMDDEDGNKKVKKKKPSIVEKYKVLKVSNIQPNVTPSDLFNILAKKWKY